MAIREARKSLGWTQRKLSEELGIPLRTIENWEGGKNKCPEWAERLIIEKLERIAQEEYKMTYVIIDDCLSRKAAIFDLRFDTKKEALQTAETEWKSFTERDKNSRDAYYVATCTLDEDGDIDWDSINPIVEYK